MTEISLDSLVAEGTTQMRGYDEKLVQQYAEAMKDGAIFPPVVVIADGAKFVLADGFHRVGAARAIKAKTIVAEVRNPAEGESAQRSAILYAVGANETHGRNRTTEDKRRAVETLLKDPEWSRWTDREIARQCRVSHPFVSTQRTKLINRGVLDDSKKRTAKRNGATYDIDTKNIGETEKPKEPASEPPKKQAAKAVSKQQKKTEWAKADDDAATAILDALAELVEAWRAATRTAQIHTRDAITQALAEFD